MGKTISEAEEQITELSLKLLYNFAARCDDAVFKPILEDMLQSSGSEHEAKAFKNALAHVDGAMMIIGDLPTVIETLNEEDDGREHARMVGEAFARSALKTIPSATLKMAVPPGLKTATVRKALLGRKCPSLASVVSVVTAKDFTVA